mmetsp:Transcript_11373/g.15488  ORF Transcript_11373/g.15488 Transcript_11373/m.15488 type:complete len:287 (-) Transcript_11373:130-990(-)|eukprot:CAMPEP_0196574462 /NCGR_PEP_ID=MMETSP1081-20130531/4172_1 /TAXON_ID=36882 /ORGANISM="Pyramimonas amylifera, Strain CCMP720" /LENGTH=286 /DNA_ID=CAMNT_0041892489 /DNA_START=193 /DNA_END=1053 /DNA_ORIENTATION=-
MVVTLIEGRSGMPLLVIKNSRGYIAEVYTHGAHVVSWKTAEGEDLLFLSEKALFQPPKPIRGGIPVCFPQFGDFGPCAQSHGFARNSTWTVVSEAREEATEVRLKLSSSEETLRMFPHEFEVEYTVGLSDSGSLQLSTVIRNTGASPMPLSYALHTYFATPDITQVKVGGLQGVRYLDSLRNRDMFTDQEEVVTFNEEVEKIYIGVPDKLKLEVAPTRSIQISTSGFPDAVVWNPWIEKAKSTADFGDEEYKKMICVEVLALKQDDAPIQIVGGGTWSCSQELLAS